MRFIYFLLFISFYIVISCTKLRKDIEGAKEFLENYNTKAEAENTLLYNAIWNCYTNITDYNQNLMVRFKIHEIIYKIIINCCCCCCIYLFFCFFCLFSFLTFKAKAQQRFANFRKEYWKKLNEWDWKNFKDDFIRRQFKKIGDIGESVLSRKKYQKYSKLKTKLEKIYSTAKVCNRPGEFNSKTCYPLEPDLNQIIANSTNWNELLWAWKGWRDATGRKMFKIFNEYGNLFREAANINGFKKADEYWKSWYDMENFDSEVDRLYQQIKPFYQNLHAYIKRKLRKIYKNNKFPKTGQIPAHLLGSIWSNSWVNIFSKIIPYPNKTNIEITKEMLNQVKKTNIL